MLVSRQVGLEVRVNTTTVDDQMNPSVAALAGGGYVVTWRSSGQDGSGGGIYAQRYDAFGVAVGSETRVNTTTANDQLYPSVTGLAGGGYIVTWMSWGQDGSGWGIYAQRYDASGVAGGVETRVNTTTANNQSYPSVAALAGGGYVVTWMSNNQDGSGGGIYAQRYDSSGSPVGVETRVNTTTADDQSFPSVAALAGGGYVVTWVSWGQDGSGYGIYAQRYDASGVAVGSETRVNTTTADEQYYPSVAPLSGGGYVVTWMSLSQDGSGWGIYAQRYDASGLAVGVETRVNTTTASDQSYPLVAALAGGGYVVTWMSNNQDGSGYGIYAQRYDASGTTVDVETRINTTTSYDQQDSSVAALPDGGYVVTWMSNGQDGSGYGIYSRRVGAGTDAFTGLTTGNDWVEGDGADDTVLATAATLTAGDVLFGGGGTDTLELSGGSYNLSLLAGFSGFERIVGSAAAESIVMAPEQLAGLTEIDGGAGADQLSFTGTGDVDLRTVAVTAVETIAVGSSRHVVVDSREEALAVSGSNARLVVDGVDLSAVDRAAIFARGIAQITDLESGLTRLANGTLIQAVPEIGVNTFTTSDQRDPTVAALPGGGYVVTWMSAGQDGSGYGVYAQRYDAAGAALGVETRVNTATANDQMYPSVAALPGGGYVVTWISYNQDGSGYGVYAQRYDAVGAALGVETRVNAATAGDQLHPSVAALSGGGYVVTWTSYGQDGSSYGIYAQRYDASGVAVGVETRINTTTADSQYAPSVATLAGGDYVVTWQSNGQDGSGWGIYAQRYDASGVPVGVETRVNATTAGNQESPVVTGLSDGGYVVTWMSYPQDGSGYGVYVQRYDSSGAAIGVETRVNTTTASDQSHPSIAALTDGG